MHGVHATSVAAVTVIRSKSVPVSSRVIMRTKAFQAGVADVRQGRGYRPAYKSAGVKEQWNYERGRAWALIAGNGSALVWRQMARVRGEYAE